MKHNVRIYLILIVEVVTMKWVSAEEEEDLTQEPRRTRGISLNRAALNPSAANLRRHPSSLYRTWLEVSGCRLTERGRGREKGEK